MIYDVNQAQIATIKKKKKKSNFEVFAVNIWINLSAALMTFVE